MHRKDYVLFNHWIFYIVFNCPILTYWFAQDSSAQKFQAQRPIENTQKRIHEDVHELSTNMSIESSKNQFHKSVLWSRIIVAYFFWWAKEIDYEPPEPEEKRDSLWRMGKHRACKCVWSYCLAMILRVFQKWGHS